MRAQGQPAWLWALLWSMWGIVWTGSFLSLGKGVSSRLGPSETQIIYFRKNGIIGDTGWLIIQSQLEPQTQGMQEPQGRAAMGMGCPSMGTSGWGELQAHDTVMAESSEYMEAEGLPGSWEWQPGPQRWELGKISWSLRFPHMCFSFPACLPEVILLGLGMESPHVLMWGKDRGGKTSKPGSPAFKWRSESRDSRGSVAWKEDLQQPGPAEEKKENQGGLPQPPHHSCGPWGLHHRQMEGKGCLVPCYLPVRDLLAFTPCPPIC